MHALADASGSDFWHAIDAQFRHVKWNGFHFFDLIFPLFIFVSGVAIPYSLGRQISAGASKQGLLVKVAKRVGVMILFGIIYNNKGSWDFANLRYASVLGQIGVAYLVASVVFIYSRSVKVYVGFILAVLVVFALAMCFIPVPGFGAGVLTPEGNLSGYIDRLMLPGIPHRGKPYDPQGILLMFAASAISMSGAVCGIFLKDSPLSGAKKSLYMTLVGLACVLVALLWNTVYPINKEIWSSSFNLLTIGLSLISLALFHFIIDVRSWSRWSQPFVVIGMNAITVYMAHRLIDFKYTSKFLLSGLMECSGDYSRFVLEVGVVVLELLLLYFMYKRKIFLKL